MGYGNRRVYRKKKLLPTERPIVPKGPKAKGSKELYKSRLEPAPVTTVTTVVSVDVRAVLQFWDGLRMY
jgi:hypothetical protein